MGAGVNGGRGSARRRDASGRRRPLQAALCRGRRCCAASTAVGRGVTRTGWRRVRVRARARAHDVAAALERLGCSRAQASGSGRRGARRGGRGLGTAGARAAVALPCSASACGRGGVELVRPWRRPGGRARWGGKEGRAGGARERQSREGGGESSARGRRERERGRGKEREKKKKKWEKEKKKEGREIKRERGGERVGADRGRGRPRVVSAACDAQAEGQTGMGQRKIWVPARFLGVSGSQAEDETRKGSSSTTKQGLARDLFLLDF